MKCKAYNLETEENRKGNIWPMFCAKKQDEEK